MRNLEIYIHTPFCVKKCAYCDFLSFPSDDNTQARYAHSLIQEIKYYGSLMKDYKVSTIYIGGGTPTWLDENLMVAIMNQIHENFNVDSEAEVSIECNPGTVTESKLRKYLGCGINRLSIGLQSADNDELKLLGRIHTYEQFLKNYELARNVGFSNINVDIICGLPYQTVTKFMNTLQKIVRIKPEHLSVYSLIIEKGTPFYETYKFDAVRQEAGMPTEILPNEDEVYKMYKVTQMLLKDAGYLQYEISNYAKNGYECRHNIGYWKRENYLGLGLGAASLIENVRYTNTRELYKYMEGCNKLHDVGENIFISNIHDEANEIARKAQMEEFMFLGLRMNEGVSRGDFERCFGMPIEAVYRDQIEELKREELLEIREGRVYLTDKGMDLSNYAMAKFLM